MCGIIGIVGHEPAAPELMDALKRLEYRGYDSAGVATLEHGVLGGGAPKASSRIWSSGWPGSRCRETSDNRLSDCAAFRRH